METARKLKMREITEHKNERESILIARIPFALFFSIIVLVSACENDRFVGVDTGTDSQVTDIGAKPVDSIVDTIGKAFGNKCKDSKECNSGICIRDCATNICSKRCTPGATIGCPSGYGCIGVSGAVEPGKFDYVCAHSCDGSVKDISAPDTSSDLSLPDQHVPDSKIPDSKIPDSKIPDSKIPDAKVPDSSKPDLIAPDLLKPPSCLNVGTAGPSMVKVPKYGGGFYCIDSTEVTRSQYLMFSKTKPTSQPIFCSWNTTYEPIQNSSGQCAKGEWPPGNKGNHPVVCLDWCDAYMFCKWAGKRLCTTKYNDFTNPGTSEWYNACSKGGTQTYPYPGTTYGINTCNGKENGLLVTVPVKSMTKCVGGYSGIFDMSGNVWEFTQACKTNTGKNDACRAAGGAYYTSKNAMGCSLLQYGDFYRSDVQSALGLRCCADTK